MHPSVFVHRLEDSFPRPSEGASELNTELLMRQSAWLAVDDHMKRGVTEHDTIDDRGIQLLKSIDRIYDISLMDIAPEIASQRSQCVLAIIDILQDDLTVKSHVYSAYERISFNHRSNTKAPLDIDRVRAEVERAEHLRAA